MSAPNTNPEKQEDKHKVPLTGMRLVVIAAVVLLVGLIIWTVSQGENPEDPAAAVESE